MLKDSVAKVTAVEQALERPRRRISRPFWPCHQVGATCTGCHRQPHIEQDANQQSIAAQGRAYLRQLPNFQKPNPNHYQPAFTNFPTTYNFGTGNVGGEGRWKRLHVLSHSGKHNPDPHPIGRTPGPGSRDCTGRGGGIITKSW